MIWWHIWRGHMIVKRSVSVPMFDPSARGLLISCSCGKLWAK